jgi:hypothetical protein
VSSAYALTVWWISHNWSNSESESESELLYNWRITENQFVLETSPLRLTTSNFIFQLNTCGYIPYWCWFSPAQSSSGPSPAGLMTTFYCLRFETPPTWRARSTYLYPPGTGWPGYTPRHWVLFSAPPTTRRATVALFDPAFTWDDSVLIWTAAYVALRYPRKCLLRARIHGHVEHPAMVCVQESHLCGNLFANLFHRNGSKFSPCPSIKTRDLHCTLETHIRQTEL